MARHRRSAGRRFHLLTVAVATGLGGMLVPPGGAQAAPGDVDVGECMAMWMCASVSTPGQDSGGGSRGDDDQRAQSGDGEVGGQEQEPRDCQVVRADPQPPSADPDWQGRDPETTTMYREVCLWGAAPRQGLTGAVTNEPVLVGEGEAPEAVPSPVQLAQQAVDQMLLEGPDIGITPAPDGEGTVGVPTWMWTSPGATTTGPNEASASAGGVTVTAVATAESIVWDMGDGTEVACLPPGTPYDGSAGMAESPDCGHVYSTASGDQPGGRYTVTATTTWAVPWDGGGQSGTITTTRSSTVDIAIGELHAVN